MTEVKPQSKARWLGLSLLLLLIAGAAAILLSRESPPPPRARSASTSTPGAVGARGRIEPEDGIMRIAAPWVNGQPSIVREIRVREGESVRAGQVLAVLDGWATAEKTLRQSEADVEVARRRLVRLRAGAKPSDVEAARAEIKRWESEYEHASGEHQRFQNLHQKNVVSTTELEEKRLALERAQRTLEGARERLKSLELVRWEDVDVGAAELAAAAAQAARARTELDRMVTRAPVDGRILRIHARPGEQASSDGVLELGRTARMFVVAEVYETDISRVRAGQRAEISGELLAAPIAGRVIEIAPQVSRSELLPADTAAFADTRVIEVKIELEQPGSVTGLIYGKVDVVIRP